MAARTLMWGKYTNCGQTCIAPDYIYVHPSVKDAFVAECRAVIKECYGETAAEQMASKNLARIVNARHTQRLAGLLADARQKGAKVVLGGDVNEQECFIQPTFLEDIPPQARIQSEEIFGPLLPIVTYTDLDAAIAHINSQPKPLSLYVWSRSERNIERVLKNTSAGGTCTRWLKLLAATPRHLVTGRRGPFVQRTDGPFFVKAALCGWQKTEATAS